MNRLTSPPAEVPTLTDIVYAQVSSPHAGPRSNATTAISRDLQKKLVRQVLQQIAKSLEARLREASPQSIGVDRNLLTAFLCGEIEQAVQDAVNQAFIQQSNKTADVAKKRKNNQPKSRPKFSYKN